MNCIIIGDFHIPQRAKDIPIKIREKISELTEKELFEYAFFTGDLTKSPELVNYLNLKTKRTLFIVVGNMDYFDGNRDAPVYQHLEISFLDGQKMTIGLTHGAQIEPRGDLDQLEQLALEKGFVILISGHTHKEEIHLTSKGILLLNPGSATGAWSFVASGIPSFMTIEIEEYSKKIIVRLYQLINNNSNISKSTSIFVFKNHQIHDQP